MHRALLGHGDIEVTLGQDKTAQLHKVMAESITTVGLCIKYCDDE